MSHPGSLWKCLILWKSLKVVASSSFLIGFYVLGKMVNL